MNEFGNENIANDEEVPKGGLKKLKLPYIDKLPVEVRRVVVFVVGFSIVVLGVALAILPGPFTIPLLILGFAVLASEFMWAEKLFTKALNGAKDAGKIIKHPLVLAFIIVVAVALVVLSFEFKVWEQMWETAQNVLPKTIA